jgi:hypothetical protein
MLEFIADRKSDISAFQILKCRNVGFTVCNEFSPRITLLLSGPDHTLIGLRYSCEPLIDELLDALSAIRFRRIDVSFGIRRDTVNTVEFTGLPAAFAKRR